MFYDQLIKICKERNVKPTPLIKSLGLSAGNLKRWQEGATVNSDILMMLSDYFGVPVDYFSRTIPITAEMLRKSLKAVQWARCTTF